MPDTQVRSIGNTRDAFDPSSQNALYVYTYTADKISQIDKTVGDITYRRTFTWSGYNLITVSEWVKL